MIGQAAGLVGLIAVTVMACQSAPLPTIGGTPTTPPQSTPKVGTTDQPTASSTPTRSPTPSPTPTGLHADGIATVAVERLGPVVDPLRPRAHRKQNRALGQLARGDRVLLVDGPLVVDGVDYWKVYPPSRAWTSLGWVRASLDGADTLQPVQPDCPSPPTSGAELAAVDPMDALVCWGSKKLAVSGALHCDWAIADGVLGGPFLRNSPNCTLDGMTMYGDAVYNLMGDNPGSPDLDGRYLVIGQFDDPRSARCRSISFGSSMNTSGDGSDEGAVVQCRLTFVASEVRSRH